MRIYGLFVLFIGITGCAALNQPINEMTACQTLPVRLTRNL